MWHYMSLLQSEFMYQKSVMPCKCLCSDYIALQHAQNITRYYFQQNL